MGGHCNVSIHGLKPKIIYVRISGFTVSKTVEVYSYELPQNSYELVAWVTSTYYTHLGLIIMYLEHWHGDIAPLIDAAPFYNEIGDTGKFTYTATNNTH